VSTLSLRRTTHWSLLSTYLKPYRIRITLLTLVLFAAIAVQVTVPLVTGRFLNAAAGSQPMTTLIDLALITIGLALVGQVLAVAETWLAESVSWDATNALRIDLVRHLLRLDPTWHSHHTQGDLIERVDGDVATLDRFFSRFVIVLAGNALLILAVIGLLFAIDWRIGTGMALFVTVALVAMLTIRRRGADAWEAERQSSANTYGFIGEHLAGLEDMRANGGGSWVLRQFTVHLRDWRTTMHRASMRGYVLFATSEGLFGLAIAFAFGACALLFQEGSLTLGTAYLIVRYADMLRRPTEQIRNEVQDLQRADASIGRIAALRAETPVIRGGTRVELPPTPLTVDLRDVTFAYDPKEPVLDNVTIHLPAGRVLGIAGRTGSGKTTLGRLIPRFIDPQAGTVELGGVDVREFDLGVLRRGIGLVAQDVHLFAATVRDNLTLFDTTVPEERVRQALVDVGLGTWVDRLPEGVETVIAGGNELSAGQAQLLACARLLLQDPAVVILDEASSRLDPASERLLHEAFGRLLAGRTGVIVAHRLETFALADDMLVLDEGRVVETGSRGELAADRNSRFAELLRTNAGEVVASAESRWPGAVGNTLACGGWPHGAGAPGPSLQGCPYLSRR
jgi:ABC-type multidrug transport system fused ATPase/permease subunit